MSEANNDIGLVGLAVMGQNLALNIADHGYKTAVYNRTASKTEAFVKAHPDTPGGLRGYPELKDFVASLKRPRKIVIMVQAGGPTDAVIDGLIPLLEKGDIIIDGGNAYWHDTIRREKALGQKQLHFVGSGVSGGEEGARFGPSLMPAGSPEAWGEIQPIWEAIAAKVDAKSGKPLEGAAAGKPVKGGVPCTAYIGTDGAGHYVKMVHNGIEYSDMQTICEAYDLMRGLLGLSAPEIAAIFKQWNTGILDSFLIEITAEVLAQKDPSSGQDFVDIVLDAAGQKGTGKWTSISALDLGAPAPTIAESVFARCISALKEERVAASKLLGAKSCGADACDAKIDKDAFIKAIHDALYCSKISAYAQGFQLMDAAQKTFNWKLNFGQIAQIWRGGCIIRAGFLQRITDAFEQDTSLRNLLLDPYFKEKILSLQSNWRMVVAMAIQKGIPVPTFSSALTYFDSYRTANLPQNLLQAQRDFFGAHSYERIDKPRGEHFHLDWTHAERPERKL